MNGPNKKRETTQNALSLEIEDLTEVFVPICDALVYESDTHMEQVISDAGKDEKTDDIEERKSQLALKTDADFSILPPCHLTDLKCVPKRAHRSTKTKQRYKTERQNPTNNY